MKKLFKECLFCTGDNNTMLCYIPAVPTLFGTRDWFRERQFFHRWGGEGMVQAVMQAMGGNGSGGGESDGE